MIFNEDKLQKEIIKTWGEFGAHNEVFKAMTLQIKELKEQLTLTDVSQQREQLLAYHNHLDSFNDPSIYNAPENMIDDYLANNSG